MMKTATFVTACAVVLAAMFSPVAALAEGSGNVRMVPAPIHRLDDESLQRGARNFVNYCLGCHTAKYMRYNRLTDIGLAEDQIRDNLIFGDAKLGDTMTNLLTLKEVQDWFGAVPPDLSVEARVRGADWLYNYLLGFYRDDASATGWNNLVFHNVGMPHVLWQLQGTRVLKEAEYEDHTRALGAATAANGLTALEPAADGKWKLITFDQQAPGTMTQVQYEGFVADLVNYMDYMAEPAKNQRIHMGIAVLLFLSVLFILVYLLKRNYWRALH